MRRCEGGGSDSGLTSHDKLNSLRGVFFELHSLLLPTYYFSCPIFFEMMTF